VRAGAPRLRGLWQQSAGRARIRSVSFTRRDLPHVQKDDRAHFVTFGTLHRLILPDWARTIILNCCKHDDGIRYRLHIVVVMPDHVHTIFTPLINQERLETHSLATIMKGIKGTSSHLINKQWPRTGQLWRPESFDHVLRSTKSLNAKVEYVRQNPVRRGLAQAPQEYPWMCWQRD
jgi:REP element-mobilizing transposase RayT